MQRLTPLSPRQWGGRTISEALEHVARHLRSRPRDVPAFIHCTVGPDGPLAVVYFEGRITEAALMVRLQADLHEMWTTEA